VSIFSHSRHRVFSQAQHPFTHNIEDIVYSHPAVTGSVTTLAHAMNHLFAVLYPTAKTAVATKADLPLTGNSIGDMRVVVNDGDNKSASYRWELREGDVAPGKWYKIYDLDFSSDSILASWQDVTQDQYVQKRGRDDSDVNGNPITGLLSGQAIYGGKSANTNLNLFANSGDGNGPSTGYIQVGDNVRPLLDNTMSLGQGGTRFKEVHSVKAVIDKLTISDDTISSSSSIIDAVDCDIITDGRLEASHIIAEDVASQLASGTLIGDLSLGDGYVISAGGTISFGGNNLVTTGDANIGLLNITANQIDSDNNVIDFNANDLVDINSVDAALGIFDAVEVGLGSNSLEIGTDGNLTKATSLSISCPGLTISGFTEFFSGIDVVQDIVSGGFIKSSTSIIATDVTEAKYVTMEGGEFGNKITSIGNRLDINASIGLVVNTPYVKPSLTTTDVGTTANPFRDLYFSGSLKLADGTAVSQSALKSVRNIINKKTGLAAADGDSLFWSTADQCWYADHPDTEISHSEISNLLNDDHIQYLRLAGRGAGQLVYGGITPLGNLTLASTINGVKGNVLFRDVLAPETDGTNIGTSSRQIGDSYHKGQAIGLRAENTTTVTLPSASAAKVGRIIYDATAKTLLVDDGGMWRRCGAEKAIVQDDTYWNGTTKTKTYTIGSSLQDSTKAVWEFSLTSTGEKLYPTITKTATQVTVTFKAAPPAASYTLIGVS
jgi:hypothetical protein